MIKSALKNFFKESVYVFVPMGIIYLFLLLTLYWLFSALLSDIGDMINSLIVLINDTAVASNISVSEFLSYSMEQINWNGNFFETIRQIISTRWIQNTVEGFFYTLNVSSETFATELSALIDVFVKSVIRDVVIALVVCFIGMLVANYATRFAIRRKTAKRNLKKIVIAAIIVPFLQTIFTVGLGIVTFILGKYAILVFLGFLVVYCFSTLTSSYLIYRDKTLTFKEVVNGKNILQHLGVIFIIVAIDLILAIILILINIPIAILMMLPIMIYSVNIIDVNTDVYVCSLIKSPKQDNKTATSNRYYAS